MSGGGNSTGFAPQTNDYAGIMAAIKQALASVICKNVLFGDTLYDLGNNYIPIISGIGYIGTPPRIEYDQNGWSDRNQRYVGGSRFVTTHDYTFWDGATDSATLSPIVVPQNVTFTAGSSDIAVPNGPLFFVGQRVLFADPGYGVFADVGYYILSVVGNVVQVGLADKVAIVATGSGTLPAALTSDRLAGTTSGVRMQDLCGVEARTFIKTGAKNSMGLAYSLLRNIYVHGRTADRGTFNAKRSIHCTNFIQCDVSAIITNDGDGQYWGANFPSASYTPGNTVFSHLFNASNGGASSALFQQGITFQAELGSILNQITVISAQHNTAVGTPVYTTTTGAQVSGQPGITVADSSKFPVGSMVQVTPAANGFEAGAMFFVVASAGNSIQLSNYKGHTPRNLNNTSAMTLKTVGFPLFEVVGVGKDAGAGQVTYSEFRNLDLEGACSAALLSQNAVGVEAVVNAAADCFAWSVVGRNWSGQLQSRRTCTTEYDTDSRVTHLGQRTSKATGDSNYNGTGLRYEDRLGVWELKVNNATKNPDFRSNFSVDSGPSVRALLPLTLIQGQFNGTKTFGNGNYDSGLTIHDGAGADTYTLPIITDLTAETSMVGMAWEFVNAGSTGLTVVTQSGQLLNNQTGKTSVVVGAGQSLALRACKTVAPVARLFWQASISPVLP